MKPLLAMMLIVAALPVRASWISICPGDAAPASARLLSRVLKPGGESRVLTVSDSSLSGCEGRTLSLPSKRIRAGAFVAASLFERSSEGLVLRAKKSKDGLRLEEIAPAAAEAAGRATAIAGVELLPELADAAFGTEQRASVRRDAGKLVLECAAGAAPAGVVLSMASRGVPTGAELNAALGYAATGSFALGLTDATRAAAEKPLMFSELTASATGAAAALPGTGIDLAAVESWTLLCPTGAARLELRSLRLEARSLRRLPERALWAWDPDAWRKRPQALINKLSAAGADTVFATVPVDLPAGRVEDSDQLRGFIAASAARGIRVWAVAGDPAAVLAEGRAEFRARAAAYALFNKEAPSGSRLEGVQYDIEPYLNAGYHLDPDSWNRAYVETIGELRREGGALKLDVAIPFWWDNQASSSGAVLDALAENVDSVTVMNYRTRLEDILRSAQPFLEWGARARRGVRIALESGPIADEEYSAYRPASSGEAVLLSNGGANILLLLDRFASVPEARTLRLSHTVRLPGSAVTFQKDRSRLQNLMPGLERLWSAWPSFAGLALHEY